MRITIGHQKSVPQAIEVADRAADDVFRGFPMGLLEIVGQQKEWSGPVMRFGFTAKMGFMKYPVCGTVEVTDKEWIVDVDLMILGRLLPDKTHRAIEARWRALLT
jgi:hypothetical protein